MMYWEYLLLIGTVMGGGALAFVYQKGYTRQLQLALSFSGAYLLGITVLHLFPEVYAHEGRQMGWWVMGGFFIQLVLEQLSGGVEHGHIHHHQHGAAWQVLIGLSLHAFLEGMPLATFAHAGHGHHHHEQEQFLLGIVLHKAPAAFSLVTLLLLSGRRRGLVWAALLGFALMSPLGALLGQYLAGTAWWGLDWQHILVAVVTGSFLHIATTILFEVDGAAQHHIPWPRLLAIVAGTGMALLSNML